MALPMLNKSKFKSFSVKSPLLFKFYITHLYCRKLRKKNYLKEEIPNCAKTWKKVL